MNCEQKVFGTRLSVTIVRFFDRVNVSSFLIVSVNFRNNYARPSRFASFSKMFRGGTVRVISIGRIAEFSLPFKEIKKSRGLRERVVVKNFP